MPTDREHALGAQMRKLQWDAAALAQMSRDNKAEREASPDGMSSMERGLMDWRAIYKEHTDD